MRGFVGFEAQAYLRFGGLWGGEFRQFVRGEIGHLVVFAKAAVQRRAFHEDPSGRRGSTEPPVAKSVFGEVPAWKNVPL